MSFLLFCFISVLPPVHWYNGILGDQIFGNFASSSPQSDPIIGLVCYCMCRTTAFLIQVQGKTNDREEIFDRIPELFLNYFHTILHFLSHRIQCRSRLT